MNSKWKALATCGIWVGVGLGLALGTFEDGASVGIAGAATSATFFVWFFG
jgi:hypothetical protein